MAARYLEQAAGCSCIEMVMVNDGRVARSVHQQWIDMFYRAVIGCEIDAVIKPQPYILLPVEKDTQYIIVL